MVYKIAVMPLPPDSDGTLRALWEVWQVEVISTKLTSGIITDGDLSRYAVATPGRDPDNPSNTVMLPSNGVMQEVGHWVAKPEEERYTLLVEEAQESAEKFVDRLLSYSVEYEYPRLEQVVTPVAEAT